VVNADGSRTVRGEARQALARVSALIVRNTAATTTGAEGAKEEVEDEEEEDMVIIDDYVLPAEPIVDYKTRFRFLFVYFGDVLLFL
jgi:hypothetical protein